MMSSDEIRQRFLQFFEQRGHLRRPSSSLVPASFDPSVLLTTAGMQPLKPYFLGQEQPPAQLMTSCQKCFRAVDIDIIGTTTRHITFFEMLGNFSIGEYFKAGAIEFAWTASLEVFGLSADDIWVTVFEGDDDLGLGPDDEAIELWEAIGVPRERIVPCPRSENFWQAGPTGPCGPCSELYFDRGLDWGTADDLPGGENERFLEFWNLVFMAYDQNPPGTVTPLPAQNVDTGMGVQRMAVIQQQVDSIFETDQFAPLIALAQERSGKTYGQTDADDVAMRILADHTRAMTFLVADGVVPSNEDRGYVLRRVMRRAIQRGRSLGIEGAFLPEFGALVVELMGHEYPELHEHRASIDTWLESEEESFGRTLANGTTMLDEIIARAQEQGEEGIGAEAAFRLHDTYGFPIDLTREIAAQHDLGVDDVGFEALMHEQRTQSQLAGGRLRTMEVSDALPGPPTTFTGYDHLEERTTVTAVTNGDQVVVKLADSPFYAQGGGQVSDSGTIECAEGDCRARVVDVLRVGDDQALVLDVQEGELHDGETVVARVDRLARHATEANHTATHLLHAALRETLGDHVHQAGSYVGPDKLRFDFTHGHRMTADELLAVEDRVNAWVGANDEVSPQQTSFDEAKAKGAMALFGEKYGDVVRMVEIGDGSYSRELCGGTHVARTAEIGLMKITSEGSSAANVRRIEALTGPEAVAYMRERDRWLQDAATALRTDPARIAERFAALQTELKSKAQGADGAGSAKIDVDALAGGAEQLEGATVLVSEVAVDDAKALLDVADRLKGKLVDAAIVLGARSDGKVAFVAAVAPALVERGVRAGDVVRTAAQVAGGGGGGRDTMAQAGGRDPEKLPDALAAAREAIETALKAGS
jgi:alanyl-tRNA synthetase